MSRTKWPDDDITEAFETVGKTTETMLDYINDLAKQLLDTSKQQKELAESVQNLTEVVHESLKLMKEKDTIDQADIERLEKRLDKVEKNIK